MIQPPCIEPGCTLGDVLDLKDHIVIEDGEAGPILRRLEEVEHPHPHRKSRLQAPRCAAPV